MNKIILLLAILTILPLGDCKASDDISLPEIIEDSLNCTYTWDASRVYLATRWEFPNKYNYGVMFLVPSNEQGHYNPDNPKHIALESWGMYDEGKYVYHIFSGNVPLGSWRLDSLWVKGYDPDVEEWNTYRIYDNRFMCSFVSFPMVGRGIK